MVSNFNVCEDVVTRDKGSLSFFWFSHAERAKNKKSKRRQNQWSGTLNVSIEKSEKRRMLGRLTEGKLSFPKPGQAHTEIWLLYCWDRETRLGDLIPCIFAWGHTLCFCCFCLLKCVYKGCFSWHMSPKVHILKEKRLFSQREADCLGQCWRSSDKMDQGQAITLIQLFSRMTFTPLAKGEHSQIQILLSKL